MFKLMVIILGCISLFVLVLTPVMAQAPGLHIVESDEQGITLEMSLPDYQIHLVTRQGTIYQQIDLQGWAKTDLAGQPSLPMFATLVGMPTLGQPEWTLLEDNHQTITLNDPLEVLPGVATSSDLVQLGQAGLMRDQVVFQLRLFPFQYDASKRQLTVYRYLKFRLTFPQNQHRAQRVATSAAFEQLLAQNLLNFTALKRPHVNPYPKTDILRVPRQKLNPLKLLVTTAGMYQVTYQDLLAQAPDFTTKDPHYLGITDSNGKAMPVWFQGDDDALFELDEGLVFWGQAIDSPYTDYNVYRLIYDDTYPALRMIEREGTPGNNTPDSSFKTTQRFEQNKIYWQAIPDEEAADHWFWTHSIVKTATPVTTTAYMFDLPQLMAAQGELQLTVRGGGRFPGLTYLMQVYLNGSPLYATPLNWSERQAKTFTATLTSLKPTGNELRLEQFLPNNAAQSELYLDRFEVAYQAAYVATDDQLSFNTALVNQFTLQGFSTDQIQLFNVTYPTDPIHIISPQIQFQNNQYQINFSFTHPNPKLSQHRFIATHQFMTPQFQLDEPSLWKSPSQAATYLIITPEIFYQAIQELAAYRQAQGETVLVVKSEDLYDEFSGGVTSPQAIKDFLIYAYTQWQTPPLYVLLAGDASNDPKNYLGNSYPNLLPTHYANSPLYGQTPADTWFSLVNGNDNYPDLIIGRLPFRSTQEVLAMTQKIKNYEQTPPSGEWQNRALLLAHNEQPEFAQDMENIAALLPPHLQPTKIYQATYNDQPVATAVNNILNEGAMLVAYSGHGNESSWSKGYQILTNTTVSQLTNGLKTPLVTTANCSTLYFALARGKSLSEYFLFNPVGGAAAVWGDAGYSYPTPSSLIHQQFYQALMSMPVGLPGQAAFIAQAQAYSINPSLQTFFDTFIYLGDPALHLPTPIHLTLTSTGPTTPVNMGQILTLQLTYTITGAKTALTLKNDLPAGVTFLAANPAPSAQYGQTLTWDNIPVGTHSVMITAQVNHQGLEHYQTLTNTAWVVDYPSHQTAWVFKVQENPVAGLTSGSPGLIPLGQTFHLAAAITQGNNVQFKWDMGNGQLKNGSLINHTYTQTGRYTVTVMAQNLSSQQTQAFTIDVGAAPNVTFTTNSPIQVGQLAIFTNTTQANDPLGATYRWNFGGYITSLTHSTYLFTQTGRYPVTLTAINRLATASITQEVEVIDTELHGLTLTHASVITVNTPALFTAKLLGGSQITFVWSWGETPFSQCCQTTTSITEHIFTTVGTHTITVTAQGGGVSETLSSTIRVVDSFPEAHFSHSAPDVLGEPTILVNQSKGSNLSYVLDWGDGNYVLTSTLLTMSHVYTQKGNYRAILTATNSQGMSVMSQTVTIVRDIQPPMAQFDLPLTLWVGQVVTMTNLSSDGGDMAYQTLWDFGDGVTSTLQQPAHYYNHVGLYTLTLRVTNSLSQSQISRQVQVYDMPIAGLTLIQTGATTVGQVLTLTAVATQGTHIQWEWQVMGQPQVKLGLEQSFLLPSGWQTIWLTATNSTNSQTLSHTLYIHDEPVSQAVFTASPATSWGQPTLFTLTTNTGTNLQYLWDFGDGQTLVSSQNVISHNYITPGNYEVWVTVQNNSSYQVLSQTLNIATCEPIRDLRLIHQPLVWVGQAALFTATTAAGSQIQFQWAAEGNTGFGITWQHVYTQPRFYPITLTATNCWGTVITQSVLMVQDAPIVGLQVIQPPVIKPNQPVMLTATIQQGTNVLYEWSFGPGATQQGPTAAYTYLTPGYHTVSVMARNGVSEVALDVLLDVRANQIIFLPFIIDN